MESLVSYQLESSVATLTMDDGKVNALSPRMVSELNRALDQALADRAVVVLTGRRGVFSAGFDLPVLRAGGDDAVALLVAGFELAERLLAFPAPVVIACSGHAIAMGAFLVLSADYRIGTSGAFKVTANEVAIGMTMPRAAIEICRQRLAPAHLVRALALAEPYTPDDAVAAGFLDRVVPGAELAATARAIAGMLTALDRKAHTESKQRLRGPTLEALRRAIEADHAEFQVRRGI
jgi:enoyl-CoA hydratase